MNEPARPPRADPPPSPAPSVWKRLRPVIVAAALAAPIGAWLAKSHRPATPSPPTHGPLFVPMWISLGFWVVLSIYWELAARKASAAETSESRASRALHLLMANGAVILSFWPFAGWPGVTWTRFAFPRVLPAWPWLPPAGIAVGAASLLLALWARRELGRHWSGEVTLKQGHELVRSGPYRRVRHPIYTGAIGMHVGTALITGRLQGLLAVTLISLAYARKIRMEERVLSGAFGPAFDAYRRESRALIPWLV